MAGDKNGLWMFTEDYVDVPPALQEARMAAAELGVGAVSSGVGSLLRVLAAVRDAKAAVEIGTDAGVSGLWTLSGMGPKGVLTTIDPDGAYQQAAADAFKAAGVPSRRARLINDRPLEVLPRLAADSYDMFTITRFPQETSEYIEHATRVLKPSGVLVVTDALWRGAAADPARREPNTVAMREVLRDMLESEAYRASLVPAGDGVLVAAKR